MSGKGKVFTEIIEEIYERYGFGSTKTVTMYPRAIEFCRCGYSAYDLEWLVKNGYLFHYEVERYDRKRNWRYKFRTDDIYGVTKRGWAVAHLYSKLIKNQNG